MKLTKILKQSTCMRYSGKVIKIKDSTCNLLIAKPINKRTISPLNNNNKIMIIIIIIIIITTIY